MIKEITTNQIVHRHAIDEIKQRLNNISTETLSNAISAQITARYPILDMKTVRNELDRLEKMAVAQEQAIALMSKEMTNLLEERIKPVLVSLDLLHGAFNGNQNSYGIAQKIGIVEKKLQEVLRKLPAAAPASKTPPEDFARSQIDAALQPCIANIKAEMKTSLSKFDIDFNGTETSEGLLQRLKRLEGFEDRIAKSEGDIKQVSEKMLAKLSEPQQPVEVLIRSQIQEALKTPIAEIKADIEPLQAPMTQLRTDMDNLVGISNDLLREQDRKIRSLEGSLNLLEKSPAEPPIPQKWVDRIEVAVQQHLDNQVAALVADLNTIRKCVDHAICLLNGAGGSEGIIMRVEKIEIGLLEKSRAKSLEVQQQQTSEELLKHFIMQEIEVKFQGLRADTTKLRDWFQTEMDTGNKELGTKIDTIWEQLTAKIKNFQEQSNRIFQDVDSHLDGHDEVQDVLNKKQADLQTAVSNIKVQLGFGRRIDSLDVAIKHGELGLIDDFNGKLKVIAALVRSSESSQRQQQLMIDDLLNRTVHLAPHNLRIRGAAQDQMRN
jgi:hypothetical protein